MQSNFDFLVALRICVELNWNDAERVAKPSMWDMRRCMSEDDDSSLTSIEEEEDATMHNRSEREPPRRSYPRPSSNHSTHTPRTTAAAANPPTASIITNLVAPHMSLKKRRKDLGHPGTGMRDFGRKAAKDPLMDKLATPRRYSTNVALRGHHTAPFRKFAKIHSGRKSPSAGWI